MNGSVPRGSRRRLFASSSPPSTRCFYSTHRRSTPFSRFLIGLISFIVYSCRFCHFFHFFCSPRWPSPSLDSLFPPPLIAVFLQEWRPLKHTYMSEGGKKMKDNNERWRLTCSAVFKKKCRKRRRLPSQLALSWEGRKNKQKQNAMKFNDIISVIAKAKYLLLRWFFRRRHGHVFLCQKRGRRSSGMSESCSFIGERREDGQPATVVAETELSHLLFSTDPFAVGASPTATSLWQPLIGWDVWSKALTESGWVQLGALVRKESTNQIVPSECFQAIPGLSQTA